MPMLAPTRVMMLGRLQPEVRTSFMPPRTTSPSFPQNLLRPVVTSGLGDTMARSYLSPSPRMSTLPRVPFLGQVGPTTQRFMFPSGSRPIGNFMLGALRRGVGRAKAISVGQIDESVEQGYEDSVDEALIAYDTSLQESDVVFTPSPSDAEILSADMGVPSRPGSAWMLPGTNYSVPRPVAAGAGLLATASAVASLYHGYRRNSRKGTGPALGWGLVWFLLGASFPVLTVPVALAQGYAQPKGR